MNSTWMSPPWMEKASPTARIPDVFRRPLGAHPRASHRDERILRHNFLPLSRTIVPSDPTRHEYPPTRAPTRTKFLLETWTRQALLSTVLGGPVEFALMTLKSTQHVSLKSLSMDFALGLAQGRRWMIRFWLWWSKLIRHEMKEGSRASSYTQRDNWFLINSSRSLSCVPKMLPVVMLKNISELYEWTCANIKNKHMNRSSSSWALLTFAVLHVLLIPVLILMISKLNSGTREGPCFAAFVMTTFA